MGFKNKKEYVYNTLRNEDIEVCLFQEVEIQKDFRINILSSKDFKLEVEKFTTKARCAIPVKNTLNYLRRDDLEDHDLSICVIDINGVIDYRIVNCYRPFNPPNNHIQTKHFTLQLIK